MLPVLFQLWITLNPPSPGGKYFQQSRNAYRELNQIYTALKAYSDTSKSLPVRLEDMPEMNTIPKLAERYSFINYSSSLDQVDIDLPIIYEKPSKDAAGRGYILFAGGAIERCDKVQETIKGFSNAGRNESNALSVAVWEGDFEKVSILLDKGLSANQTGHSKWTLLMKAAYRGHLDILRELLKHGAKVNRNYQEHNAINLAARQGHAEIVKELLAHGASTAPNPEPSYHISSPLAFAASEGKIEVVKILIESGVSMKTGDASKALICALNKNHYDIARLLMEKGTDGSSALICEFHVNCGDTVELLVSSGANVNTCDKDGYTALSWMVNNGNTKTVRFLLENGANPDVRGLKNMTLMENAVKMGHREIVTLLEKYSAKRQH